MAAARAIIRIWWSFVMGMAWICCTACWCFLDWVPPISPTQNSVSKKFNGLFLLILLCCPPFLFHSTAIWIWCSFHAHHQIIWGTRVAKSTRNSSMKQNGKVGQNGNLAMTNWILHSFLMIIQLHFYFAISFFYEFTNSNYCRASLATTPAAKLPSSISSVVQCCKILNLEL